MAGGWCFDCGHGYRGPFPLHQGTLGHRSAVTPRRRARKAAPAWSFGAAHEPSEEQDRQWVQEHRERMMTEATERIIEITGRAPAFSGGGRGQVATATYRGVAIEGRGTSRAAALSDLADRLAEHAERVGPPPAAPAPRVRATVDDAMEAIRSVMAYDVDLRMDEREEPHLVWEGKRLVAVYPCTGECMTSTERVCDCRCNGDTHGLVERLQGRGKAPVLYGDKPCLCGCGGTTKRRYVPGHDAKHHAMLKAQAKAGAI